MSDTATSTFEQPDKVSTGTKDEVSHSENEKPSCGTEVDVSQSEKPLLSCGTEEDLSQSGKPSSPPSSSCLVCNCNEPGEEPARSPLTQTNVDTLCDILQLTPIPIDGLVEGLAKYHICASCNARIDGFKLLMVQLEALMGQIEVVRYSVAQQLLQSSAQDSIAGLSTPRQILSSQLMSARAGANAPQSDDANSEVDEDEEGTKSKKATKRSASAVSQENNEDEGTEGKDTEDTWEMAANPGHFLDFKSAGSDQAHSSSTSGNPGNSSQGEPPKKKRQTCCSVCNKYCKTKYELISHEKTHFAKKQFRCPHPECNTVFTLEVNLEKHLLQAHRNKFACPQCGNSFAKRSILLVHLRTHDVTGRYFTCPKCPTSFTHRYNLNKHLKSHTGVGEDQPHACPQCGACFARIPNLSAHIKIHGDGFGWDNDRLNLPTGSVPDDTPDESKKVSSTGHELGVIYDDGESESDMEADSD